MPKENRVLLHNAGKTDPVSVEAYVSLGGFEALSRAVTLDHRTILNELQEAQLLGRGGAGFPTGKKWQFLYEIPETPKYIVCNADEGEPGTFKDRALLQHSPLRVIEGMVIAGWMFRSPRGFIFLRGEYRNLQNTLLQALENARSAGFLGKSVLGIDGFDFDIAILSGAGSYVCGEETALLNAVEGRRGEPRNRPPYPVVRGLYSKPTLLNNVETFANIAPILKNGASWFRSLGTSTGAGTKLFSLSGHAKRPGIYEVGLGSVTLHDILYDKELGGGTSTGRPIKFYHLGGHSGSIGFPEQMYTPYNYNELKMVGLTIGSGAIVVLDDSVCLVDYCKNVMKFFVHESCGKCTPCRLGTVRMLKVLTNLTQGFGRPGDVEKLEELGMQISLLADCGLGQSVYKAIASCLKFRREEFETHANGKCLSGSCKQCGGDAK